MQTCEVVIIWEVVGHFGNLAHIPTIIAHYKKYWRLGHDGSTVVVGAYAFKNSSFLIIFLRSSPSLALPSVVQSADRRYGQTVPSSYLLHVLVMPTYIIESFITVFSCHPLRCCVSSTDLWLSSMYFFSSSLWCDFIYAISLVWFLDMHLHPVHTIWASLFFIISVIKFIRSAEV